MRGNFRLIVAEVAQSVEHLCRRQMRQMRGNLLGRDAHSPEFDNGTDWCTRPLDDRLSAKNLRIANDVSMFRGSRHE